MEETRFIFAGRLHFGTLLTDELIDDYEIGFVLLFNTNREFEIGNFPTDICRTRLAHRTRNAGRIVFAIRANPIYPQALFCTREIHSSIPITVQLFESELIFFDRNQSVNIIRQCLNILNSVDVENLASYSNELFQLAAGVERFRIHQHLATARENDGR